MNSVQSFIIIIINILLFTNDKNFLHSFSQNKLIKVNQKIYHISV